MSDVKVFVGNAKAKENKFGGKEVVIGLQQKDLDTLQQHLNGKGWVNVVLKSNKEGKPYLQIDTWVPKAKTTSAPAGAESNDEPEQDLPF